MRNGRRARWRGALTMSCGRCELTNGQFSLLMSLNRPEPPSIGSVANLLAMDRTTLTAALKPLQRRGLLKVAVDKQDRRSRRLTITAAGRALLARAFPIWKQTHAEVERLIANASADAVRTRPARAVVTDRKLLRSSPRWRGSRAKNLARRL